MVYERGQKRDLTRRNIQDMSGIVSNRSQEQLSARCHEKTRMLEFYGISKLSRFQMPGPMSTRFTHLVSLALPAWQNLVSILEILD